MGLIPRLKKRLTSLIWLAEPHSEWKPPQLPLGRWHSEPTLPHPMNWEREPDWLAPDQVTDCIG